MKKILFLIIALVVVFGILQNKEAPAPHAKTSKVKSPKIITKKFPPVPEVQSPRSPAAVPVSPSLPPRKVKVSFGESPIKIGNSFTVVENMAGVPKASYLPSMGKKLAENNHFIFFRPNHPDADAWPVAQDTSSERFFPVSHILHIKGVDTELRENLKSEGLLEFYYHPRLKLLSVEASPSTVLKSYQDLLSRGYDARLEVLKDPHQSK